MNFLAKYFFVTTLFISCAADSSQKHKSAGTADILPSENNKEETSEYKPAFAGQTKIAPVKTRQPCKVEQLSEDLKKPWGIVNLPDGRFLVTEKEGNMRIVTTAGKLGKPITGIPKVNSDGQGGLLGLTIDPKFNINRMVYWAFSENTSDGNLTAIAKGKLAADESKFENAIIIYRATPAHNSVLHYGSRILFDNTGNLIFSTGERSDLETRPQAQDLNSSLGKIIRITTDGKTPPGNPFTAAKGRTEIYSYGHRNVQGLAFHPSTGELWESEFGPKGGDEINIIKPGKNYGWPIITYGHEYSGEKVPGGITRKEGMEQPVYYWDPVLSPSGITFYEGKLFPEWQNNLFVCGLSSTHIARLVIQNNKVTGEESLLEDLNQRFRDIVVGKDGALYTITDAGRLYKIGR